VHAAWFRLADLLRRAAADTSGAYAMAFALALVPIVAAAGLAVDYGRAQVVRDELQHAVDAAALAAARQSTLEENELKDYAMSLIVANSSFKADDVDLAVTKTAEGVAVAASIVTQTYLMPILGYDQLNLSASSSVMVGTGDIEVALMLDVTGSMCADGVGPCSSSPKLNGLKAAAQALVDTVVTGDQSQRATRVSLVPFSTRVRVGPDGGGSALMQAMTGLDPTWTGWYEECTDWSGSGGSEDEGNWVCNASQTKHAVNWKVMPCITDRFYNDPWGYGPTDAGPATGTWLNGHGGDRFPLSRDSADTPFTSGAGQTPGDPSFSWTYASDGYCADVSEKSQLLPLTSDRDLLTDRINDLEAFGSTAGALGTAVAWYTLSPNWSGVFTGASAPKSYADLAPDPLSGVPRLKKAAVLMTDGVYNTYRGWKGAGQQEVSGWAVDVCENMKAEGIEIYTVGFALNELTEAERTIAEQTLHDCSTDASHYYDATTVAELTQAFQTIGSRLSALRITH
jgi:Flp pilus assembly protein TadG